MGIKTGIFEMIIKLFKPDIQQLKNNNWVLTFQQYTSHIYTYSTPWGGVKWVGLF